MDFSKVLLSIGFREVPGIFNGKAYQYKNGSYSIKAEFLGMIPPLGFSPGFSIHTTHSEGRIMQYEPIYVPVEVDSFEQGLAYLVYALGIFGGRYKQGMPDWIEKGLQFKDLLPWEAEKIRQREAYEKLPKANMEASWMRVLIRMLKEWNATKNKNTEALISMHFDGKYLIFTWGSKSIPVPATGKKWQNIFYLNSEFLNSLPKRIYKRSRIFLIKDNQLHFENTRHEIVHMDVLDS